MDYSPSFSPDGKWIAFTTERNASADVCRVHTDGTGLERLTDNPAYDDQAVLSTDSRSLAFVSSRGTGRAHVWLLDLVSRRTSLLTPHAGSDFRTKLADSPGDAHCAWSPDGSALVFTSARMGFKDVRVFATTPQPYGELFIIRADGTGLRQLTDNQWEDGTPIWFSEAPLDQAVSCSTWS
jgi:Tol biopolymer transport system component